MDMTVRFHKTYDTNLKPAYGATIIDSRFSLANDTPLKEISYHGLKDIMQKEFHTEIADYPPEESEE